MAKSKYRKSSRSTSKSKESRRSRSRNRKRKTRRKKSKSNNKSNSSPSNSSSSSRSNSHRKETNKNVSVDQNEALTNSDYDTNKKCDSSLLTSENTLNETSKIESSDDACNNNSENPNEITLSQSNNLTKLLNNSFTPLPVLNKIQTSVSINPSVKIKLVTKRSKERILEPIPNPLLEIVAKSKSITDMNKLKKQKTIMDDNNNSVDVSKLKFDQQNAVNTDDKSSLKTIENTKEDKSSKKHKKQSKESDLNDKEKKKEEKLSKKRKKHSKNNEIIENDTSKVKEKEKKKDENVEKTSSQLDKTKKRELSVSRVSADSINRNKKVKIDRSKSPIKPITDLDNHLNDSLCYYEIENDDHEDGKKVSLVTKKIRYELSLYDIDWSVLINSNQYLQKYRNIKTNSQVKFKFLNNSRFLNLIPTFCLTSVYLDEATQNRVYDYLKQFIQQHYISANLSSVTSNVTQPSSSSSNVLTRNLKINLHKNTINSQQYSFIKSDLNSYLNINSYSCSNLTNDYSFKYGTCARKDLNERKRIFFNNNSYRTSNTNNVSKTPTLHNINLYQQYIDLIKSEIL